MHAKRIRVKWPLGELIAQLDDTARLAVWTDARFPWQRMSFGQ